MYSAPAVGYPVGRSRFAGALIGVIVVCGVLAQLLWSQATGELGWQQEFGLVGCLAASCWVVRQWWCTPKGVLSWDGVVWNWTTGMQPVLVTPEIIIDFQRVLLLQLHSPIGNHCTWVWLECASCPSRWVALRRAIFVNTKSHADHQVDIVSTPVGLARSDS